MVLFLRIKYHLLGPASSLFPRHIIYDYNNELKMLSMPLLETRYTKLCVLSTYLTPSPPEACQPFPYASCRWALAGSWRSRSLCRRIRQGDMPHVQNVGQCARHCFAVPVMVRAAARIFPAVLVIVPHFCAHFAGVLFQ